MTGKFKDYRQSKSVSVVMLFVTVFLAVLIKASFNIDISFAFAVSAVVYAAARILTARGSFTAYRDKVFFCLGFMQYVYSYADIESAETKADFYTGRLGLQPYMAISINFTDGNTVTFCDESLPKNALSTPEKHKEFHENHQFTKLSNYINQRAGR
ncbi:MAG: hypothetical protein K2H90_03630 [Oscillospiraceae bacterium]|nr:hypothetical protein [Oscillospiraceae bacterium]